MRNQFCFSWKCNRYDTSGGIVKEIVRWL